MKKIIIDGNEACAKASYMFTEVAGIYPITPSSPMSEHVDDWASIGKKNIFGTNVKVIEMQSEAGAAGLVHGSLQSGMLTSTYTSSQGLLLMIPSMYKIAGEMLPCTMHVASRSLSTHALSIFGDHQDIYATRDTGFCMISSSSVQDAYFLAIISHLSSIKSSLPFMHFFDGFRTSHEINKIDVLEDNELSDLIDEKALKKFRQKALNIHNPVTRGTNQNGDIYFQIAESRNNFYKQAIDDVIYYMNLINKKANTNYKPFNYYGGKSASKVIVAMGSVCECVKEVLNEDNGLIEVHLYRPFSVKHLLEVIPKTVKHVFVLNRSKEFGSRGPLYLDVVDALKQLPVTIASGRYGLSSKDTTPGMIKAIYDNIPTRDFTIGIEDDVTNLSLPYNEIDASTSYECLIYGYGSDGMTSASKSILDLIGQKKYVQGYFEYDSKKSGSVTVSHMRFSDSKITSTYFVHHPNLVVISKDSYLYSFDTISNIRENGILIINTNKTDKEILDILKPYKNTLNENKVKLYTVDAFEISKKYKLGNKISMIMESTIMHIMGYDSLIDDIKLFIEKKFANKGKSIIKSNIDAIYDVKNYIREITLDKEYSESNFKYTSIYDYIAHRMGNDLKVSSFKGMEDGTFKHNLDLNGNNDVSLFWDKNNCTTCGMCAFTCPHGVVRTFLLDEEEFEKSPNNIKENCIKTKDGYFTIGISSKNCTGCGVCVSVCPGKKGIKALQFSDAFDNNYDYLIKNVTNKKTNTNTIKGCSLLKNRFAYHGACAGCGQTAYLKLLTSLFGEHLIIANATGCSSIYGGAIPNLPYEVSWMNSLFEDNAEFGYGLLTGYNKGREKVEKFMLNHKNPLFDIWLNNKDDFEVTKKVYERLDYSKYPFLEENKNYIVKPSIWAVGGDGWAYDIGFSGIDQVLSSGEDINILVLDSQVYSNTGGQSSKATPIGAVAKFASNGKKTAKKDLGRIAMSYPNVYVAQISLGANMMQTIKAFNEAYNHKGPSIIIAYTPCIAHGIKGGLTNSINMESMAVKCGYFPIYRYDGTFNLDFKEPDFDLYEEFLNNQTRFSSLSNVNKDYKNILKLNKENAIKRFEYYKSLDLNQK